ncbi:hypothetical protein Tco_1447517 [Tanacetum coccineum]
MTQPQRQADVHQDELCPPNKRYTLMDAKKKIHFDNPLCPNEIKILTNILQNHPLRFNIVASSSVPWIYLGTIFQLPQATDNNHERFVAALKFLEMVPFFLNDLGFTLELRSSSNVKTTGLHYSLEHPSTLIPYPRFTKLIVSDYMTTFPEISRRVRDKYHNLEDDEMVKNIVNLGKNKTGVGMKIPNVPTTQLQPIESTQGMHRTTSTPRSPNPDVDARESNTIQLSIAEQKSRDELEAKQNVEKVEEHLKVEEIEKLVEGTENVENNEVVNFVINNQEVPDTRLELRSYKESPKVEKNVDVSQPVNVIEEEDESAEDDYELKRKEKGKEVEETRNTLPHTPTRSTRIHSTLISLDTKKLQELTVTDPKPSSSTPSSSSPKPMLSMSQHILSLFKPKTGRFK